MSAVIEKAQNLIERIVGESGYELVDIEYKKLYNEMHLIIYISNQQGIALDDCEKVNNALDGPLEELDPTNGAPYVLDISSPGLDRPFKTQRDFERNYNTMVELKLYAPLKGGKKAYEGTLLNRNLQQTTISNEEGEIVIENSKIALVRPLVKFD